jgi:hypothetical protein
MRTILIALALCLAAEAAQAASPLQGQWQIDAPNEPNYVGVVLIDAAGRVIWDSPQDAGRPANFRGYVARAAPVAEIVFTNSVDVVHTYCTVLSSDLLNCYNVRKKGPSIPFMLTRIGPGPASLLK